MKRARELRESGREETKREAGGKRDKLKRKGANSEMSGKRDGDVTLGEK